MTTGLLYLHISGGMLGLLLGTIILSLKKGTKTHKQIGIIYFYGMLASSVSAIILAIIRGHSFLLMVGIFTIYMLVSGLRALNRKQGTADRLLSYGLGFTGITYFIFSIIDLFSGNSWFLSLGFSVGCLAFFFGDLIYKTKKLYVDYKNRLKKHIGRMLGSYIASVTAFIVVNTNFGIWGWVIPSVVGSFVIAHFSKNATK